MLLSIPTAFWEERHLKDDGRSGSARDVVLQLKNPYHDGTTHIVMSPPELMQRLAALVPRPRLHLIRFHGVLAPHAKLRPEIIPSSGRQAGDLPGPGFPSVPVNTNTPPADHAETPPAWRRCA